MYIITVDYFTMLHLWHLYRYIFFIWKHYFLKFFHLFIIPVVASSSISSACFVDVVFFVIDMSSGTHYNIVYDILLQILLSFFMTCKLYVKFVLIHLSIFSYVKMIFNIYLLHIWQFFSYVQMDIFLQMHFVYSY